jgi:hypothetical protein
MVNLTVGFDRQRPHVGERDFHADSYAEDECRPFGRLQRISVGVCVRLNIIEYPNHCRDVCLSFINTLTAILLHQSFSLNRACKPLKRLPVYGGRTLRVELS